MKKILLFFSIIIMLSACSSSKTGENAPALSKDVMKEIPAFSLVDLNDEVIDSSQFKGKVLIIDFWATWCPPCRKEIPHFIELYEEYAEKGLVVIGVSVDEDIQALEKYVDENGVNYITLKTDRERRVTQDFGGITGIPTTFVVDKDGMIVAKFIGYRDKSVFEEVLKNLL